MAHQESISEEIRHRAAEFINRESNRNSLITVTHVALSKNQRNADILISVIPEGQAINALNFLKRMRTDVRDYLKKTTRLKFIPTIDFELDTNDKNLVEPKENLD